MTGDQQDAPGAELERLEQEIADLEARAIELRRRIGDRADLRAHHRDLVEQRPNIHPKCTSLPTAATPADTFGDTGRDGIPRRPRRLPATDVLLLSELMTTGLDSEDLARMPAVATAIKRCSSNDDQRQANVSPAA